MCAFFLYSRESLAPFDNSSQTDKAATELEKKSRPALPARLQIPKIGVDTTIESVGLTTIGAMDTPAVPENVAWYQYGPRPGEKGSAVIDGHLDTEDQTAAVFKDLSTLTTGDIISVIDAEGATYTFKVKDFKYYQSNDNTGEVFGNNQGIFLNLITCAGEWNQERDDYEERLVVFSELVSAE